MNSFKNFKNALLVSTAALAISAASTAHAAPVDANANANLVAGNAGDPANAEGILKNGGGNTAVTITPGAAEFVFGADDTKSVVNSVAGNLGINIVGAAANAPVFAGDIETTAAGTIIVTVGSANGDSTAVIQGNVIDGGGDVSFVLGNNNAADATNLIVDSANDEDLSIDAAIDAAGADDVTKLIVRDSDGAGNTITFKKAVGSNVLDEIALESGNIVFENTVGTIPATGTVTNDATVTFKGAATLGATTNNGTATFEAAATAQSLTNAAGATADFQNNLTTTTTFDNAGTATVGGNLIVTTALGNVAGATLDVTGTTTVTTTTTNAGTINATGDATLTGAVDNDGAITVGGNLDAGAALENGANSTINVTGNITDVTGVTTNNGTINVTGTSLFSGAVTNTSTINATGAVDFDGGITNTGTVAAAGNMQVGAALLDNNGGTITIGGDLDADAALTNQANSTINVTGNITDVAGITTNVGTINATGTAQFTGATTNTGNITLGGNTTFTGALTNDGTITIADGTTTTLTNALVGGTAGNIVVGTSVDAAGNVSAGKLSAAAGGDFSKQTFSFSGAVTKGTVASFITGHVLNEGATAGLTDSYLYNFDLTANTNGADTDLTIAQNNTLTSALKNPGNSGAETAIDAAMARNDNPAGLQTALDQISSATTATAVNNAAESILPVVDASSVIATTNVINQNRAIVDNRLASLRGYGHTGMAAGGHAKDKRSWGQFFGSVGEQGKRDGVQGYDVSSYGLAVGFDKDIGENLNVGAAFSYAKSNTDSEDAANTDTDIDTYQFTLYGEKQLEDNRFVNAQLGYAFSKNDVTRTLPVSRSFDYDSNQFAFSTDLGFRHSIGSGVDLVPHIGLNYMRFDADSYTDKATGLKTDMDSLNVFEPEIGIKVSKEGKQFSPYASAEFGYDTIGDQVQTTGRFGPTGVSFTTKGFKAQKERLSLGTGFGLRTDDKWDVSADYNFDYKADYTSHTGLLRAAYKF